MFRFIRGLNEIYANENKDIKPTGRDYGLADVPGHKSFKPHESKRYSFNLNRKKADATVKSGRKSDSHVDWQWHHILQEAGYPRSSITESDEGNGRKKVYVKRNDVAEIASVLGDSNSHLLKEILMDSESTSQDDVDCLIEDYELEYYNFSSVINFDSESIDSTKETLERLSRIANELRFSSKNESNDEEDSPKRFMMKSKEDDHDHQISTVLIDHPDETIVHTIHQVTEINDQHDCNDLVMEDQMYYDGNENDWIDNPVQKILHTVHLIKKIPGEEPKLSSETEENKESSYFISSKEEESLRAQEEEEEGGCGGETEGSIRRRSGMGERITNSSSCSSFNDQVIDDGETSSIQMDDSPIQHSPNILIPSTSTARSFAFPVLAAELPITPARTPHGRRPPTRAHLLRRPLWRVLACCKCIK